MKKFLGIQNKLTLLYEQITIGKLIVYKQEQDKTFKQKKRSIWSIFKWNCASFDFIKNYYHFQSTKLANYLTEIKMFYEIQIGLYQMFENLGQNIPT